MKNQYREGDCLKWGGGGLGHFADLRGGGGFEGVNIPMHTMLSPLSFSSWKQKFQNIQYLMHLEKSVCLFNFKIFLIF